MAVYQGCVVKRWCINKLWIILHNISTWLGSCITIWIKIQIYGGCRYTRNTPFVICCCVQLVILVSGGLRIQLGAKLINAFTRYIIAHIERWICADMLMMNLWRVIYLWEAALLLNNIEWLYPQSTNKSLRYGQLSILYCNRRQNTHQSQRRWWIQHQPQWVVPFVILSSEFRSLPRVLGFVTMLWLTCGEQLWGTQRQVSILNGLPWKWRRF
jgi:hypothetical protein